MKPSWLVVCDRRNHITRARLNAEDRFAPAAIREPHTVWPHHPTVGRSCPAGASAFPVGPIASADNPSASLRGSTYADSAEPDMSGHSPATAPPEAPTARRDA